MADRTLERQVIYITGASGSGKSRFTRKCVKEYNKAYKDREVYLSSALTEDESVDEVKPKRFIMDDRMVSEPIRAEDLKDSLCLFDDIDVLPNKKIKEAVYQILNEILQIGRHHRILHHYEPFTY